MEPYKNILFNGLVDHIEENVCDRMGKKERKKSYIFMFGEGISLLFEILIWKKRIKRETLLHITKRCGHIHIQEEQEVKKQ